MMAKKAETSFTFAPPDRKMIVVNGDIELRVFVGNFYVNEVSGFRFQVSGAGRRCF